MIHLADNGAMTIIFLIALAALIVGAGLFGVDSRPHDTRNRSNF
jgi:hypothetical protein